MVTKNILIALASICALLLYLGFSQDLFFAKLAIPFLIILAVVYVMSPQINWWYHQRKPPKLDDRLRQIINQHSTFYQHLSLEGKQRFRDRVALYMMAHDFVGMPKKNVPEDVKGIVAACVVQLTFGLPDFYFPAFEKIIVYNHAFPSPQFPKNFHISETQKEDGVLLFSAPHLVKGFTQPASYFNIGVYEAMEVFQKAQPERVFPQMPKQVQNNLAQISNFPNDKLLEYVGLPKLNALSVAVTYFLNFPERFKSALPELYQSFKDMLNLDPINGSQPIVYINESR